MEEEIWKAIPHYEGLYEASSKGRIRTCENKTTFTERHGVRHWKQRVLKHKGSNHKLGYRVTLWKDGQSKDWLVHRLVGMAFLGESELTINHIDGNRLNNNVENLEWCSIEENIRKGFETGLYTTQKKVKLINKSTNEIRLFRSMSLASAHIGRNHGYISDRTRKNKFEDANYKWEIPN